MSRYSAIGKTRRCEEWHEQGGRGEQVSGVVHAFDELGNGHVDGCIKQEYFMDDVCSAWFLGVQLRYM